ncbi:uncharacterized protein LOC110975530 isoform X2 [Acanthaster planci]|uniref:Uncharacterized protein LOC110975530 isoform X2 n=1 Tax=Acanthaster planci TaxID=133434 RepID=A0A8B7XU68_ACAPL|nr:uncharacterized protein LOC110975530 isoform X2 [Acanthaster planci]
MEHRYARYFASSVVVILTAIVCLVQNSHWFAPICPAVFQPAPVIRLTNSEFRSNTSTNTSSNSREKESASSTAAPPRIVTVGPPSQPLDYEFVISHYNEKLDWVKPLASHSHVYHKGKDKGPPFDVYKWEKLPNVGRESHTYLHHIIHNYDNLADLTVFLQGTGPFKDPHWCFPTPMDFVQHAKKKEYCKITQTYGGWTRLRHVSKWLKMLQRGEMRRANLTTGEFYQAVFGTPHPDTVPVCLTACFSASRENLRRFPVSLYERAISFVNDHSNPEEGHYLERLWATIANAKRNP